MNRYLFFTLWGLLSACVGSETSVSPSRTAAADLATLEDTPHVVFWQGFEHAWTHNHRWNRFGNWASPESSCDAASCWNLQHAAASGTSPDEARVQTFLTAGQQGDLGFVQTRAEAHFDLQMGVPGWRQNHLTQISLADLPHEQAAAIRGRELVGFLNGFDVVAEGSSAKPISFLVAVEDARYVEATDSVSVHWSAYLRMDCTSEECPSASFLAYNVEVELAVLASDTSLVLDTQRVHRRYGWDAPRNLLGSGKNPFAEELQPAPVTQALDGLRPQGTPVPVFTRLAMHLYRWDDTSKAPDQHMVAWNSHVHAETDSAGTVHLHTDLMFKNWVPEMRRVQVFAYEEVGAADMRAAVTLLDFPHPVVTTQWRTSHAWRGHEAPAFGEDAVTRYALTGVTP